jgi:hypothetical protein
LSQIFVIKILYISVSSPLMIKCHKMIYKETAYTYSIFTHSS